MNINSSKIIALLGPTNTGKTYVAIEKMLEFDTGIFGLPLRLLAREVYDKIIKKIDPKKVALITGEEKIIPLSAKYYLCTVESMPIDKNLDFVAVDEIQMCSDHERGHIFTDRLLNLRGDKTTMFMGSYSMKNIIKKLDEDQYDSIILAKAGLLSLSIENRISEVFECEKIVPPAGQGTIVIQSRNDDDKLINILSKINHFETSIEAKVERKILSVLEGDCNTAAGIYANVRGKNVNIIAELFSDDGNKKFSYKDECKIEEALKIAKKAGDDLKKQFEMDK